MAYKQNYVGAYVGFAGSGKSLSLAQLCVLEMLEGRRVWSNMPVEVKKDTGLYKLLNRELKIKQQLKTEPLDMKLLYLLDEDLIEGTVAIDEAGYFADSRQSGSVKNRLINACIRQLRHRQLNFFYTAFNFFRVDSRLRDETDFVVECNDLANSSWGEDISVDYGAFIVRRYYDLSGKITHGKCVSPEYPRDKRPFKVTQFEGIPWWWCYDTRKSQDLEEAFSKIQLDVVTRISNRDSWDDETQNQILGVLIDFKQQGYDRVPNNELWDRLREKGIDGSPNTLGRYIPHSIKRHYSHSLGQLYDLTNFGGSNSNSPY